MFEPSNFPKEPGGIAVSLTDDLTSIEQRRGFMLEFDKPYHPELDRAIETGSCELVLSELNKARKHYPEPEITFNTALVAALRQGRPNTALLLLDNGVQAKPSTLRTAASCGYISVVERVLNQLSWPINRPINGYTILGSAIKHDESVKWLLKEGADPNLEDAFAETPFSHAVRFGSPDTLDLLLEAGADVNRGTPLHKALGRDSLMVERLVKLGAPVNKLSGEGSKFWDDAMMPRETALHIACSKGQYDNVRLLLAAGADPTINQWCQKAEVPDSSPLDVARATNRNEIVSLLETDVRNVRSNI